MGGLPFSVDSQSWVLEEGERGFAAKSLTRANDS